MANIASKKAPIIAFFGTKGGVGKTTITNKFADLVAMAKERPKVLIIDFDVDARGTTVLRTRGKSFSCKTMHEYIANRYSDVEEIIDVTETIEGKGQEYKEGGLYLIPSATPDAKETFRTIADIKYNDLLSNVRSLVNSAIKKYDISCVLIDCGPTIDPLTATAAHISDKAFIIGQNEPISREALNEYRAKIRDNYYDDFNSMKMGIILNKVRATILDEWDFFAVVPFTIDIVDVGEGLRDVDQVRLTLLDYYILDIVKRTFEEKKYSHLIPDSKVILSEDWLKFLENTPKLMNSFRMKCYLISKKFFLPYIGGILTACLLILKYPFEIEEIFNVSIDYFFIPTIALLVGATAIRLYYKEPAFYLYNLVNKKEDYLFEELRKRSGRRVLERLKGWSEKLKEMKKKE